MFSGDLWAGAEVVVANLLEQLAENGTVEPIAVSLNDGILIRRLASRGIETHVIDEAHRSLPALAWTCSRRLRGRRIDLVHSHRYKENLMTTLVARMLSIRRTVTTVHGIPEINPKARLRGRLVRAIDRLNVRACFDSVVAVSAEMRTELLDWFRVPQDRVRLIYNGIAVPAAADIADTEGGDDVHIGTVGRLVPVKGHRLFLELAANLHRRYPNVRFSILGDGPVKAQLMADTERLGIGDRVAFVPAQADPRPYYRDLDIYVNTSLHEGLPLSVLEAMACGKPVVAARVGGIPEVIRHGQDGFLIDGRRAHAFAACCARMIDEPALRRSMGRTARARIVATFGRERMAADYRRLYEELCG